MSFYDVLFVLLAFSYVLSASAMWVNWYLNRHELAVRDWAVALSIILLGCALIAFARSYVPDSESMISLNTYSFLRDFGRSLNGLALMILWAGTLRFVGRPAPRKRTLFVAWLVFFVLLLIAHPLEMSEAWGIAWISALITICSALNLYEVLKLRVGGIATWFMSAGFSLMIVAWGVRAVISFADLNRSVDSGLDAVIMFTAVISACACLFGMVLLTNQRRIDRLNDLESRDPLTNVLNRRAFLEEADYLLENAKKNHQKCALVLLNVDNFKDINDEFGLESGDMALRQLSIISMRTLGRRDLFARCDADEFVFFLFGKDGIQAQPMMMRLQALIQQSLVESIKGSFQIGVSVGISDCEQARSLDETIGQAKQALCQAKSQGRNQVVLWQKGTNAGNHSIEANFST